MGRLNLEAPAAGWWPRGGKSFHNGGFQARPNWRPGPPHFPSPQAPSRRADWGPASRTREAKKGFHTGPCSGLPAGACAACRSRADWPAKEPAYACRLNSGHRYPDFTSPAPGGQQVMRRPSDPQRPGGRPGQLGGLRRSVPGRLPGAAELQAQGGVPPVRKQVGCRPQRVRLADSGPGRNSGGGPYTPTIRHHHSPLVPQPRRTPRWPQGPRPLNPAVRPQAAQKLSPQDPARPGPTGQLPCRGTKST
jgi:hypothetical protein